NLPPFSQEPAQPMSGAPQPPVSPGANYFDPGGQAPATADFATPAMPPAASSQPAAAAESSWTPSDSDIRDVFSRQSQGPTTQASAGFSPVSNFNAVPSQSQKNSDSFSGAPSSTDTHGEEHFETHSSEAVTSSHDSFSAAVGHPPTGMPPAASNTTYQA